MIELIAIFSQFLIFAIIFSFPLNPGNLNKLIGNSGSSFNYIDCHVINIIIFANILLIISFFNFNLTNVFLTFLIISIIFVIKRNKEYFLILNKKNSFKFIFFFIFTIAIFISTSYAPRLEWDGFHWITKALVFFNNNDIQNLKYSGMPEYPHLGGYIWAFFWKNSLLQYEYFGRLFYVYFYVISIFSILNAVKLKSQNIIFITIFSLILITYDRYLFGGYQEYLIFSTLLVASRFIASINFDKKIEHNKLLLILFIISTLMWFKDEGIFYFLIFGSLLIFMQHCKLNIKFYYLIGILFLIFIQHYLQKNIIGIYGFSTEFFSEKVINQILNFKILAYKTMLISKHIVISFIKYPLWIIIITSFLFINIFQKNSLIKYFFYALILNYVFIYAVYLNDPSPISNPSENELLYEFVLKVTIDRVIFQTSGFYILIFLLLLNKINKVDSKYK